MGQGSTYTHNRCRPSTHPDNSRPRVTSRAIQRTLIPIKGSRDRWERSNDRRCIPAIKSLYRIWDHRWATHRGWNSSISTRHSPRKLYPSCGSNACNNYEKSACADSSGVWYPTSPR